jgi:tetratricopeptide (TPR) repeat protein
MDYRDRRAPAERLFSQAFRHQMEGRFDEAEDVYRRSIALFPTAEAFTFLGWTLSFLERQGEAIQACKSAIELDPDYGNPYNDIGAYCIQLGKLDEAIPWLERAKRAPRYDCHHYPFYNLGRVYEIQGRFAEALREYRGAVEQARAKSVEYHHATTAVARLEKILKLSGS